MKKLFFYCLSIFLPFFLKAHEVYVLSGEEINEALKRPPLDFVSVIKNQGLQFSFWTLLAITIIVIVLLISILRSVEVHIDPILYKIKRYASIIAQVTLGLSLIASAYYGAIFGVELPIIDQFGIYTGLVQTVLYVLGFMLLLGIYPQLASLGVFVLFGFLFHRYGFYMFNYGAYFGEALVLVIFGGAYSIISTKKILQKTKFWKVHYLLSKYKFALLRVTFGFSLIYASVYAKLMHGTLALETVTKYNLTDYFHFDPLFLVLGAFIVEILIGLFFMIGFELRFTAVFFLVFLVLSILFFKEAVWPHIILIGTTLSIFCHGYDRFSVETALIKRDKDLEPVL